jgi:ATP-dependent protease HslVU (ClpYQ) peptidase subunit
MYAAIQNARVGSGGTYALAAAHYTIEMDLSADEIARQTIR